MRPEEAYVLVIEDDTNNQQIIADLLHMAGVRNISVAASGFSAMARSAALTADYDWRRGRRGALSRVIDRSDRVVVDADGRSRIKE